MKTNENPLCPRERMYVYFDSHGGWHVWLKGQRWGVDPWIEVVW